MLTLFRTRITAIWHLLMAATLLSWWFGASGGVTHTTTVVMTIAFAKCYLVGMYFMELLHAPKFLKLGFQIWCLIGWAGILCIYVAT